MAIATKYAAGAINKKEELMLTKEAKERLITEMKQPDKYSLRDLFRIRDALQILAYYNLEDKELLKQVEAFIMQEKR